MSENNNNCVTIRNNEVCGPHIGGLVERANEMNLSLDNAMYGSDDGLCAEILFQVNEETSALLSDGGCVNTVYLCGDEATIYTDGPTTTFQSEIAKICDTNPEFERCETLEYNTYQINYTTLIEVESREANEFVPSSFAVDGSLVAAVSMTEDTSLDQENNVVCNQRIGIKIKDVLLEVDSNVVLRASAQRENETTALDLEMQKDSSNVITLQMLNEEETTKNLLNDFDISSENTGLSLNQLLNQILPEAAGEVFERMVEPGQTAKIVFKIDGTEIEINSAEMRRDANRDFTPADPIQGVRPEESSLTCATIDLRKDSKGKEVSFAPPSLTATILVLMLINKVIKSSRHIGFNWKDLLRNSFPWIKIKNGSDKQGTTIKEVKEEKELVAKAVEMEKAVKLVDIETLTQNPERISLDFDQTQIISTIFADISLACRVIEDKENMTDRDALLLSVLKSDTDKLKPLIDSIESTRKRLRDKKVLVISKKDTDTIN